MCYWCIIKDNVSTVKDITAIIFTAIATILAVLTYINAKKTILAPIRNEVIKKQSIILAELLEKLAKYCESDLGFDYQKILHINLLVILDEYGFVIPKTKYVLNELKSEIHSSMYFGDGSEYELVDTFKKKSNIKRTTPPGKKKFNELKKGIVQINEIKVTRTYYNFFNDLEHFSEDPFLPKNIKDTIKILIKDSQFNIKNNMSKSLKKFLLNFYNLYSKNNKVSFNINGVWNEYNHSKINHRKNIKQLKKEISKYLRVEEKW